MENVLDTQQKAIQWRTTGWNWEPALKGERFLTQSSQAICLRQKCLYLTIKRVNTLTCCLNIVKQIKLPGTEGGRSRR